jgi:Glycine-rich domain-containing protein-like
MKNSIKSPFSVDLVENSLKHKWFLQTIHDLGISLQRPSFLSLQRYVHCWLPLVQKHPHLLLIPPADVAWLWHCHRLAPEDYEEYVVGRFGMLLDTNLPFALQHGHAETYSQDSLTTQQLWEKEFPRDSFFVAGNKNSAGTEEEEDEEEAVVVSDDPTSSSSPGLLGDFDLLASTDRQATFLWQISSPSFDEMAFLDQGVENYRRFLLLKPKAQRLRKILVPT